MRIKRSLAAFVFGLFTLAGAAQNEKEQVSFNPHWYMQINAGASHTIGEADFSDLISPAAALSGGYQFTPLWGLRFGVSGWQAKGAWASPKSVYDYNFLQGNVDATLDLGNLFCGYNYKRIFNPYIFLGVGVNGAFNNDEAVALNDAGNLMEYLWRDNKISVAGRGGIGAGFRLSDHVYFNLEVNANLLTDKFNSKKGDNVDWHFNALAGIAIKFGKTHKKVEPVVEEEPVPVKPVEETPKQEVKKEEPQKPVEAKVEPLRVNVFFLINSSDIRSAEKSKLMNLAKYMKENPTKKVSVCGYADKETGTPAINSRLSQNRAKAVAELLKKEGIAEDRITVDYKGDTVQPFGDSDKNRVAICISE